MIKNSKQMKTNTNKLSQLDPKKAGIDVGAASVFVCISDNSGSQDVREYPTFTEDLENLAIWLKDQGIESVAMESTGVYWIPIFEILDNRGFEVLLVNAYHLKNVPGRKTDVKDCQWIQQLHSCGLLRGSFRPTDEFVRLRAYVRQRRQLFERAAIQVQLMHKAFTQMNIQLNHVLSDITGKTGLSIVQAILRGERDPSTLANYRDPRCKKDVQEIAKALKGNWREEHLFALRQAYESYEFHHKHVMECEQEIRRLLQQIEDSSLKDQEHSSQYRQDSPTIKQINKKTTYNRSPYHFDTRDLMGGICGVDLTEIPGIDSNLAITILAELGTDMSKWKSEKHFASWLGLCPGNKISGGKVLNSRTKPSSNRVAAALRLAANALYRSQTALGAFFRRMRSRLGAPKAITAAAHKLAKILYRMMKDHLGYKEMGQSYYEEQHRNRVLATLRRKAKEMGCILVPIEVKE